MDGFVKAVKGKKPVRVVIGGPSGSGKTFTALTFAKYLESVTGKPTAAIDTEYYRMNLYADKFDFTVKNWEPPFDPKKLSETIKMLGREGFGQLIVDSSTHFYSGEGGLLQIVQDSARQKFGGNQYAGWAVGTPIQNELIDTIIRSPLHIIFCTRAKQGYLEVQKGTKTVYEKSGMELQQRDGFEFDFDFSLMMDMENNATISKGMVYVPTGAYIKKPNEDAIKDIMRSINENTVEQSAIPNQKESVADISEIKDKTQSLCIELAKDDKESVVEMIRKYNADGLLPKVKDYESLNSLYNDLVAFKNKKEN